MPILFDFNPPVIAHRGASAYAPENTMIAFVKAVQMGATWLEFDIMQAYSGELVVFHDEDLARTTDTQGLLMHYPYSYLQTLDVGKWFSPIFADERIPTLQQVLQWLNFMPLYINIEIKPHLFQEEKIIIQLVRELSSYLSLIHRILFSSFSLKTLEILRFYLPNVLIGVLMHEWDAKWYDQTNAIQAISVHANDTIITQERVMHIKSKEKKLLVYTVNNKKRAKQLFSLGIDAIFSDKPDILLG